MKQHRCDDESLEQATQSLAEAFLTLRNAEECLCLLDDLCTPAELEALVDRWRAAVLLERGMPYREIHDRTGVSVTTIGRVARYLSRGAGGYRLALSRLQVGKGKRTTTSEARRENDGDDESNGNGDHRQQLRSGGSR